jgi:TRAP-type uncharacterized transport system fused permease subunit
MTASRIFRADLWFSVGVRRTPAGLLNTLLNAYAALISLWVVYAAVGALLAPWMLAAVFLSMMYTLAFLLVGATPVSDPAKPHPFDWLLAAASLATGIYFFMQSEVLGERISLLFPLEGWQVIAGWSLFLLSLEITVRRL